MYEEIKLEAARTTHFIHSRAVVSVHRPAREAAPREWVRPSSSGRQGAVPVEVELERGFEMVFIFTTFG